MSRSAYHKWACGKVSRRAEENERLADKIEKIHEESPDKGYRRLNDELRHDHGIHVNDKRVLRICRARNIKSTIYRCIHETLESGYPITEERRKLLETTAGQIERTVPDLAERVELSNQKELELEPPNTGGMTFC